MGTVFVATDATTGQSVALKVPVDARAHGERFAREARLLEAIRDDALVAFVDAGEHEGTAFLVMQWIEGEDLAARLQRGPLTVAETIALLERVAAGLSALHRAGVVHRDLKPQNVLLRSGEPGRAVLADLGIARPLEASVALTGTHAAVGTVGYMAPEQARGERDVDTRADVFSLGCLAFECLTGRPAFVGPHAVAVLAKLLLEDPPHVRDVAPHVPAKLATLVDSWLRRDRAQRPVDGLEVGQALAGLRELGHAPTVSEVPVLPSRRSIERRLVAVILLEPAAPTEGASDAEGSASSGRRQIAADVAARFGANAVALAGGAIAAWSEKDGEASDRAVAAARLALGLLDVFPDHRISLALGGGEPRASTPVGPAIDRAASLLRAASPGQITLDEATASLVEARFAVTRGPEVCVLGDERPASAGGRLLLGKPTATVGRERELGALTSAFEAAAADEAASATLVIGPPGMGKSRLRTELMRRVEGRAMVLAGRGDVALPGSPGTLARALVAQAVGGASSASSATEVAEALGGLALPPRTSALLAELLGHDAGAAIHPGVRADRSVFAENLRLAFLEWLGACAARGPLVVVVDDVQWIDPTSLRWLLDALASAAERPWMAALFGRPEVLETFPSLGTSPRVHHLSLSPLPRKAAERLCQQVLGDAAPPGVVARIVRQADGNAFYLEELLRLAAAGRSDQLPDTLVAITQARLERLSPLQRRALGAASVLGEQFWPDAVRAMEGAEVAAALDVLVREELVEPSASPRFAGVRELAFRHALAREAAYASVGEGGPALHAMAATWLRSVGERDPLVLARHLEAAGEREAALAALRDGLGQVFVSGDTSGTLSIAARMMRLGAEGELLGEVLALVSSARFLGGDVERGVEDAARAVQMLPLGDPWFVAAGTLLIAALAGVPHEGISTVLGQVAMLEPSELRPSAATGFALFITALALHHMGARGAAEALLAKAERVPGRDAPGAEAFRAWCDLASYPRVDWGDARGGLDALRRANRSFEALRDPLGTVHAPLWLGVAYQILFANDLAIATLDQVLPRAAARGQTLAAGLSLMHRAMCLAEVERRDEARAALADLARGPVGVLRDTSTIMLGGLEAEEGRAASAREHLERVQVDQVRSIAYSVLWVAAMGQVLLLEGRPDEAMALVDRTRRDVMLGDWAMLHRVRLMAIELRAARALGAPLRATAARQLLEEAAAAIAFDPELSAAWRSAAAVRELLGALEA